MNPLDDGSFTSISLSSIRKYLLRSSSLLVLATRRPDGAAATESVDAPAKSAATSRYEDIGCFRVCDEKSLEDLEIIDTISREYRQNNPRKHRELPLIFPTNKQSPDKMADGQAAGDVDDSSLPGLSRGCFPGGSYETSTRP
eukprot:jgi/Bigna1/128779/aug1.7_g3487